MPRPGHPHRHRAALTLKGLQIIRSMRAAVMQSCTAHLAALLLEGLQALSIQAVQVGGVRALVAARHQLRAHIIHALGRRLRLLLKLIVPAGDQQLSSIRGAHQSLYPPHLVPHEGTVFSSCRGKDMVPTASCLLECQMLLD